MLKNNQRVVMVISQFYPLLGGAEVQAQRLASNLRKKGMEIFVLTRSMKGLPDFEVIEGIPVHRRIKTIGLPFLWGICFIVSASIFLYTRRKDYDIIHCHILQEFQTIVSVLFKYLCKKKVIVKMSSSGETSDLKLLKHMICGKYVLRWIRNVDAIVSVCKKSSMEIRESGFPEENLIEIPNGIDTVRFAECAHRTGRERRNITFVGRMDSYKGVDYLLRAFKDVLSKVDDVHLTIVGSGPDETILKKMAHDLGIQDRVSFKGRQENVLGELHDTDIFVLPSLSEGMSNVLLEAMACGLPVVATNVGGNSDLIQDGHNGLLIPPRDSISLTKALLELIENEELAQRLGKQARVTVEEHYAMNHIVDSYRELYRQLVS